MFTVRWVRSALNDLADIWNQADSGDRDAISSAANRIDKSLTTRPSEQGESRAQGRRVLIELPLVVVFEIVEQDRFVRVLQVRRPTRRLGS
jgi:hypothetical protein